MSVDIYFYIEIKDKNGKWHLVKWYSKNRYDEYDETDKVVTINGKEYIENVEKWTGLAWRDELGYGGALMDRTSSLPEDISDDLKEILRQSADRDKEIYIKSFGYSQEEAEKYDYYRKYSCMYLDDMWAIINDKKDEWRKRTLEIMTRGQMRDISEKLDTIEKLVRGEEVKKKRKAKKEEEYYDYEDTLDYQFDEALNDIFCLQRETNEIADTAKNYFSCYWPDEKSIRVIYYVN